MSYRPVGFLGSNGNGALAFEVIMNGERASYPTMAAALDVASRSASGSTTGATVVSPPGSENVMAHIDPQGRSRMVFAERQDEYDQTVQALDETAQEIGVQVQRAAEAAAPVIEDIQVQAQATPIPILALGAGAIVGGLVTKGNVLGFLGGAAAGYFLDKAIRR
jgi:nucleotide-binding universal stress UspA family protein